MKAATATAAPAPSAPAQSAEKNVKTPAWMSISNMDELNAYLKKSKVGSTKADAIRARWNEAHQSLPSDPYDASAADRTFFADAAAQLPPLNSEEKASIKATVENALRKPAAAGGSKKPPSHVTPLAAVQPSPERGLTTRYIDPNMIDVREDWNARVDFGDLEELKASIKAQKQLDGHGVINDLRVKEKANGRYELIDGERRLLSIMGLIDEGEVFTFGIPAKVEPAESTDADLIIKMFTANMGKPFLPYEEALYYKRLQDSGMTIREIEEKTGRSDNSIVGAMALLSADDDLVQAVIKGAIGSTMAKAIAVNARGDKAKQKELTARAKEVKKTGDRKKAQALKKDIDDVRRAKAAKKAPNLKLKARKADEGEIAALGANIGARLKELMEKFGMPFDADLTEWVSNDRELQIAANYGALTALKAVMGVKVKVEF